MSLNESIIEISMTRNQFIFYFFIDEATIYKAFKKNPITSDSYLNVTWSHMKAEADMVVL